MCNEMYWVQSFHKSDGKNQFIVRVVSNMNNPNNKITEAVNNSPATWENQEWRADWESAQGTE